jgi:hypothetical protein
MPCLLSGKNIGVRGFSGTLSPFNLIFMDIRRLEKQYRDIRSKSRRDKVSELE